MQITQWCIWYNNIWTYEHNIYIYIILYILCMYFIYMYLYICYGYYIWYNIIYNICNRYNIYVYTHNRHIYIYISSICHWKITWSSYRKLVWKRFETTIIDFLSDALIDWVMSHEFNLHSKPTFYSYSNFIVCSVSRFVLAVAILSHHVCFNWNFLEVITWV